MYREHTHQPKRGGAYVSFASVAKASPLLFLAGFFAGLAVML